MTMQPGFLARLGLAEDADERQVRRAYARELKQIDQERDLEGFQYLRACYEAALAWAAERAASAAAVPAEATAEVEGGPAADAGAAPMAQGDAHPAPQAPEGVEQVHPGVLGDGVFADFRVRMAELATQPERMGREEAARVAPWTEALRAALADPRLLHLYARVIFEHHVAALLAEGWRPGHHLLLPAAVETFGWDLDRSALARLGHAGALLDDALDQRAMFQSQDILARTQQRELLHLLREGRQPDEDTVRAYAASVASVTYYFPTLLGIVAPHDLAAAWRAQVTDDMLRVAVPVEEDGRKRPWWKGGASPRLAASIAIFFLFRLVSLLGTHEAQPPRFDAANEAERREQLLHPKPIYEDEPVTDERIEEIHRRIDYRPGKDVPPGEQEVLFQVVLDADGSVLGMNKLRIPNDPAYAVAVEKAILASGPFPPKTAKSINIGFRTTVMERSGAQGNGGAGAPPVTRERMAEIRRRIDYRPGKDVPPGEQRVKFEVVLNEDGAIRRMKALTTPGDPAYAEAVEQAIRSTAPFPRETARTFVIGFQAKVAHRRPAGKLDKAGDDDS